MSPRLTLTALLAMIAFSASNVSAAEPTSALDRFDAIGTQPMTNDFAGEQRGGFGLGIAFGAIANTVAKKMGSSYRYTLFAPLKACAPAKATDCR